MANTALTQIGLAAWWLFLLALLTIGASLDGGAYGIGEEGTFTVEEQSIRDVRRTGQRSGPPINGGVMRLAVIVLKVSIFMGIASSTLMAQPRPIPPAPVPAPSPDPLPPAPVPAPKPEPIPPAPIPAPH